MQLKVVLIALVALIGFSEAGLVRRQNVPQSAPIECIYASDTSKVRCKSLTGVSVSCDAVLVNDPLPFIRFNMGQTNAFTNPQDAKFPLSPLRRNAGVQAPAGAVYSLFSSASSTTDNGIRVDSVCWPNIVSLIVNGVSPDQRPTPDSSNKVVVGQVRVVSTEEAQI